MAKKIRPEQEFLSDKDLARARRLTQTIKGSNGLPENASSVDRVKYALCEQFVKYAIKNNVSQRQLASELAVSESRVSQIVHYNIQKITIDKLVELLERIQGRVTLKVA